MPRKRRTIQVLLLEDSEHLGDVGEIVDVRPGYARNLLFPSGVACKVTADALRRVERAKTVAAKRRVERAKEVAALATRLKSFAITLEERASEEGHLFGSVTAATIVAALAQEGISIEEKQVQLESHLKELGIYNVPIRLMQDETVEIRVWVVEPTE